MKTIEDAINDYRNKLNVHDFDLIRIDQAFRDGANFMQNQYEEKLRWISIEEEFPVKSHTQWSDEVLVKFFYDHAPEAIYHEVAQFETIGKFFEDSNGEKICNVTHWRPIEIK